MRWTSTAILSGLLLLCLGTASTAQEAAEGEAEAQTQTEASAEIHPYIEYNGGLTIIRNQNLSGARDNSGTSPVRFGGKWETDEPGWMVGGAIGARFAEYFRSELNLSYRRSDVDRMTVGGKPPADGDVQLFAAMVNVYGELTDLDFDLKPYLGIGIGYGLITLDAESDDESATRAISVDSDDSVFVWNLMAGVSFPFTETTEFSLGYRYLATTDPDFSARKVVGVGTGGTTEPRRFESEFDAHEVVFGVRFNF